MEILQRDDTGWCNSCSPHQAARTHTQKVVQHGPEVPSLTFKMLRNLVSSKPEPDCKECSIGLLDKRKTMPRPLLNT